MLVAAHTRPGTGVNLGSATPLTKRLWANTELGANMTYRCVLGLIPKHRLLKHPERTLPELRRKLTGHNSSSQRKQNQTQCESGRSEAGTARSPDLRSMSDLVRAPTPCRNASPRSSTTSTSRRIPAVGGKSYGTWPSLSHATHVNRLRNAARPAALREPAASRYRCGRHPGSSNA